MFCSFSIFIVLFLLSFSCLSQINFLPFLSDTATDIILPPIDNKTAVTKVLIIVPGGKVPIENYTLIGKSIQKFSNFNLWVGIPKCLANLCDPLDPTSFGLNSAIERTIHKINASISFTLEISSIIISGHSLGAIGARHFFDLNSNYFGLILFGTQYIGDHEDFKGTLGFPVSLSSFLSPLLIVTGELDAIPFTHAARIFKQREHLNEDEKKKKVVVVIEG